MEKASTRYLIEKFGSEEGEVNVSFGLRPSGTIHLGNMMTMGLAAGLSREIGPHRTSLNITICDLDLPDSTDWSIHKNGYAKHYRDLGDTEGCHNTVAEHTRESIGDFMRALGRTSHIDYRLLSLSDIQRDSKYREGLKRILDTPEAIHLINPELPEETVPVYPLCPECKGSYTGAQKSKRNVYREGRIFTFCTNAECAIEEFDVDVLDTARDLSVHLFIDPIRDAVMEPHANIHVFGGDYSEEHSLNKIPKFEKILRLMGIAAPNQHLPYVLIGPTIYSRDGSKMSKSRNNGLNTRQLKDYLGEDYPERVLEFTMGLVNQGYHHVDYGLVNDNLLKQQVEN